MLSDLHQAGFDLHTSNHAAAILATDFPDALAELEAALRGFRIPVTELIGSGGGEAVSTQRLRRGLAAAGWRKHNFVVETKIDGVTREATSHEIDHVRRMPAGVLALEIEWNNKDPFFDRDLENFQRLHAQNAISVGIIVTRGSALQAGMVERIGGFLTAQGHAAEENLYGYGMKPRTGRQRDAVARQIAEGRSFADAFSRSFVADKFGPSTTHWQKLRDRIARGVGSPCPLLLIGLPPGAVAA